MITHHVFATLALNAKNHSLLAQISPTVKHREEQLQKELTHVIDVIEQKATQGKNVTALKKLVLELREEFDAMKR